MFAFDTVFEPVDFGFVASALKEGILAAATLLG
jgi:hypothetical protein